jgi:hypothetical protein
MTGLQTRYLSTDAKTIQDVVSAITHTHGKVLITTRLAMDLMDSLG